MKTARVRRKCQDRLDALRAAGLVIPQPFDAADLTAKVAQILGRTINLIAINMPAGAPYGMTLWTDDGGHIVAYEQRATRVHQDLIVGHELAHILLEHRPVPVNNPAVLQMIFPSLSPELVHRALNRTGVYSQTEEQEAEVMATLLIGGASNGRRCEPVVDLAPDEAAVRDRLGKWLQANE